MAPITRRTFLKATVRTSATLTIAGAAGAGYTIYGEPGWLAVEHVDVPIRGLPAALEGITIAQLSDLHVSEETSAAHVAQAVALAARERPDLIVLTGDYVTSGQEFIPAAVRAVAGLRAPLGVYAVLGNHDHWSGAPDRLTAGFEDAGIGMLNNAHRRLPVRDSAIWLAGVDDPWLEQADLEHALRGIPEDGLRILLAHEPDFADTAARYGIQLQLSGHSHGGQVRLPLAGHIVVPPMSRRYPIGLQRVQGTSALVYTNRGIGVVAPAVRFNCRPEVTILRLRCAT
jgi:predicted MPP superfamily phosphohydrolase